MKRTLLFTALLIMIGVNAQEDQKKISIEKGIWTLGGSLNFRTISSNSQQEEFNFNNERESFSINISPRFGYAIINNLVVGLSIGYGFSTNDTENFSEENGISNTESRNETVSVTPNIRGYKTLGDNFALYLQGEFGFSRTWTENISSDNGRRTSVGDSFFVGFRPGVSFFISKNFAFESSIGSLRYTNGKSDFENGGTFEFEDLSLNFNPSNILFGLNYFF